MNANRIKYLLDDFFKEKSNDYGNYYTQFEKLANIFNILTNKNITAEDCVLVLILLKLLRESNNHKNDNIIDAIGYLRMLIK